MADDDELINLAEAGRKLRPPGYGINWLYGWRKTYGNFPQAKRVHPIDGRRKSYSLRELKAWRDRILNPPPESNPGFIPVEMEKPREAGHCKLCGRLMELPCTTHLESMDCEGKKAVTRNRNESFFGGM